jgi:hypothetical protein
LRCNVGSNNTAVGSASLFCNAGGENAGVGYAALRNATGDTNTAVGAFSLYDNTTGSKNTAIGYCSGKNITDAINTIAVGFCAEPSNSDFHTVWGNSNNNVCNCVYTAWSNVSDCRDKTEIQTLPDNLGLELITKLRPVKFKWDHRESYVHKCGFDYGKKDGTLSGDKEHYGLIAQELKQALSELDAKFDGLGHDPQKDAYRLTYEELIAPVIKSIQELDGRLKKLEQNQNS